MQSLEAANLKRWIMVMGDYVSEKEQLSFKHTIFQLGKFVTGD